MFDVAGWRSSCDAAAAGVRDTAKTYRELLDHLSEVKGEESVWGGVDVRRAGRSEAGGGCDKTEAPQPLPPPAPPLSSAV